MTNIIKDSHLEGMLKRPRDNSELYLTIDHNANGYTLYLAEEGKSGVLEMLGFSVSKRGIYDQLLCACRVIQAMHQDRGDYMVSIVNIILSGAEEDQLPTISTVELEDILAQQEDEEIIEESESEIDEQDDS